MYRRVPSPLEYFGYIFHHSMLLVGPVCTFKEYMDFIEGRDIARATEKVSGIHQSILRRIHTLTEGKLA